MHTEAFINDNDIKPKILAIEMALGAQSQWNALVDVHVGGVVRPMGSHPTTEYPSTPPSVT